MDETKETQGVATSEDTKGTSETTKTFTEEQVVERERQAKSDVSAELGRMKKLNEGLIKSSQAIQDRLDKRDREEVEREREKYQDKPDKLSAITEKQARREAESKLTKVEQELEDEKAKTAEAQGVSAKYTKEQNAREIATRLGVDFKPLMKFTDGSTEAMEDLAKSLPKKGETQTITPDSGKTIGGGEGIPTNLEQFKKWVETIPQEEYEKLKPQIDKMRASGKIK